MRRIIFTFLSVLLLLILKRFARFEMLRVKRNFENIILNILQVLTTQKFTAFRDKIRANFVKVQTIRQFLENIFFQTLVHAWKYLL